MAFRLDFTPKRHGWHFANQYVNHIFGSITTRGLCGGMSATVWDYYAAGLPIPSHQPDDFPDGDSGSHVPQTGTPLREYIYQRQMDTLDILNPVHIGRWLLTGDIDNAERFREDVRRDEFPKLRKQLEVDRAFGIVGLFNPKDGDVTGHQVLAYGFDESAGGTGILVYDCNHPDQEVLIAPSADPAGSRAFELRINGRVVDHYRGWFFMDWAYNRLNPVHPRYQDLVVTSGIRIDEPRPQVGAPLHLSYTVSNVGQAPAHLDQLFVWIRKDGVNRDDLAGGGDGNATPIPPGGTRLIRTGTNAARGPAGAYQAGASYLLSEEWRNLPGTGAQIDFGVAASGQTDGWRDLGGILTGDVTAGLHADGRVIVLGPGTDGRIYCRSQTAPDANESWTPWAAIGGLAGCVGRPCVVLNRDRRLELFARRDNGELWHAWQTAPNGGWSDWQSRGDRCTSAPAAALNQDGRVEVFVTRDGGQVFHAYQRVLNGLWSGLEPLGNGALLGPPAVAANPDGRLEVIGRGLDGGSCHIWQTAPNGGWSQWSSWGGKFTTSLTIKAQGNHQLEAYGTQLDNRAWHIWPQAGTPTGWTNWTPYGGVTLPSDAHYCAEVNPTGGTSLFVRGAGGDILERHHIAQAPWWSDWASLGGATIGDACVVRRPNGKLSLFARGPARNVVHRYQTGDGSWVR